MSLLKTKVKVCLARKKLRCNKRGSIQDVILIAATLLAVAIVVLIAFKISNQFNTKLSDSSAMDRYDNDNRSRKAFNEINSMYPGVIDNSFLFLVAGLSIAAFILASMVRIHPMFFVFFLLILVIIIFLCGVFSNIYQEMATNPQFSDVAARLTFITNIMRFLPFIVGTLGIMLSIVMYKNYQNA